MHNYHAVHKRFPAGNIAATVGNLDRPGTGWQVALLPHTEHQGLYDKIDFDRSQAYFTVIPKTGEPQAKACSHGSNYGHCPSDPSETVRVGLAGVPWAHTSYSGSIGSQQTAAGGACDRWVTPDMNYHEHGTANRAFVQLPHPGGVDPEQQISGMFGRFQPFAVTSSSLREDGTSNTIGVGEIISDCGHNPDRGWWHWDSGQNAGAGTSTPMNTMTSCATDRDDCLSRRYFACGADCWRQGESNFEMGFRSYHAGGANFCMMDGSTQFISESINYRAYQRLGGRADGQQVGRLFD